MNLVALHIETRAPRRRTIVTDPLLYRSNAEMREIQNERLKSQINLLATASPYYKKCFKRNKIDASKIRTVDDLAQLPVTTKKDLIQEPENFRLVHKDPDILNTIWQAMYTAGTTTGKPTPFYYTTYDYYAMLLHVKRTGEIIGLTQNDISINLCPLASMPHAAYQGALDTNIALGTPVISALTGARFPRFPVHRTTDDAVSMIESHRVTALHGMPNFIRSLLIRAVEEKRDFSRVRLFHIFGEPCHQGMRKDMHDLLEKLGAKDVFVAISLGSTESGGAIGVECREGGGMHCPSPDLFHVEIVDPNTYRPLPTGDVGLLCLTHLDRRGTALLRFVMGDIISISDEPCPHCGRNGLRLMGEPYRVSDIVKLKSTLINPDIIKGVLTSIDGVDEYRIIFTKENLNDPFSMDALKIQVSVKAGVDPDVLSKEIMIRVRNAVEVKPLVEFLSRAEIYDPQKSTKAVRVVDERPRPKG
jgi:phenylacetate-CoA ligase